MDKIDIALGAVGLGVLGLIGYAVLGSKSNEVESDEPFAFTQNVYEHPYHVYRYKDDGHQEDLPYYETNSLAAADNIAANVSRTRGQAVVVDAVRDMVLRIFYQGRVAFTNPNA